MSSIRSRMCMYITLLLLSLGGATKSLMRSLMYMYMCV
jgi:hypothetical protein